MKSQAEEIALSLRAYAVAHLRGISWTNEYERDWISEPGSEPRAWAASLRVQTDLEVLQKLHIRYKNAGSQYGYDFYIL